MNLNNSERIEASHAWAEIFFNDIGWVGYDVSNGISPNENYIFLSRGFDYNDVAPIKGVKIGTSEEKINYWYNYKRKSINIKKSHDLLCWS